MVFLSVIFAGAAAPSPAQGPIDVNSAIRSFHIGRMQVSVLRVGRLAIPNDGSVFATNAHPPEVAKVLKRAGQPAETLYLDINVLLIRAGKRIILIDTGYGEKNKSALKDSLRSLDVSPLHITDVFITHSHPDHVSGLIDEYGRPTFPHAVIHISAKEWQVMQRNADTRSIAAAVRPQVRTFVPGGQLVPGIRSEPLYGHTQGHVMYELASGGERLLDIGDAAHSSVVSLARPDWFLAWDFNKPLAAQNRRSELRLLARSKERVFAVHFPFPGVGTIVQGAHGFAFAPGIPSR